MISMQKKTPIYLISLAQDSQRRKELKQKFPKSYAQFIQIEATDGRQLTATEYYEKAIKFFRKSNRIMLPTELGCTLSHIHALEEFIKTNSQYALILEDDVEGEDKDIIKILNLIKNFEPKSLLICGRIANKNYPFGKKTSIEGLYEISHLTHQFIHRAWSYVVTKKSANEIIEYHKHNLTIADWWNDIFKDTDTKIYYTNILSHPICRAKSHMETDRAQFNQSLWEKITSIKSIKHKLKKEIVKVIIQLKGYKKIKD